MRQFCIENSCLQTIHAAIDASHDVIATATGTRESRHPVSRATVIRHNASGTPIGPQIFAWIKGKGRNVAKGSHERAIVLREMCLSAIFYDPKIVLLRDRHDCKHVRRLSIEMHWNDSNRGRCDLSFDIDGIDREGFLIRIAEHDAAASLRDRLRC